MSLQLLTITFASVAQPASKQQRERVVALVTESAAHYEAGRFKEAVTLLNEAYAIEKSPTILYNLGRAHEGLGDLEAAVKAYRAYLDAAPNADDRGAIERRAATLERQVAERVRLQEERDAAARREAEARREAKTNRTPDAASPSPSKPSALPWVVAGVGAATLIGGSVVGLRARALHGQAKDAELAADAQRQNDDAQTWATVANVCFAVGGALTLTGLGFAVLGGGDSTPRGGVFLYGRSF